MEFKDYTGNTIPRGELHMDKNRQKEEERLERFERFKSSVAVVAVVGVGAGLYGFKLGRRFGYTKGAKDGYITAGQEMLAAWKDHAEELRKSRGE